jgi:hypothetical protein
MADGITAWNADRIAANLRSRMIRNAEKAGKHLVKAAKVKLDVQGPPRSEPGEAPRKEHGELVKSVAARVVIESGGGTRSAITLIVGTPLDYGLILEEGRSGQGLAARPWLRPTLAEEGRTVGRIMAGKG